MRDAGAKEVHFRIASPPITHPDYYGIDTPERDKLLAATHDLEGMRRFIGADTLAFLSVEGIYLAINESGRNAARVVNSRTALMIVSDGYDTGEPERLAAEMRRLRRRCRRIIWLNPLIGWRDYSPTARGMQAALPYVDLFAPAHNLASLAAIEQHLARM